jgi:hypothetical protein
MIGGRASEEEIAKELENRDESQLEVLWDQTHSREEELQRNLAKQHERRGEIVAEMKSLGEDRRLLIARLELGCVERRLEKAVREWRVLAVASLLLEIIRDVYERERQPETLAEASGYLQRFTEGQYVRVWTPLGEHLLQVDDREGRSLPLEVLSQGTREAVFLSLRLALAAAYARRGAVLPLVLDDVMVNFDVERARLAAEVFRDFAAAGGQILVFTCHEHIIEIFGRLGMEVRLLPSNSRANAVVHPAEIDFTEEEEPAEVEEVAQAESAPEEEDVEVFVASEPEEEEMGVDDLIAGVPTEPDPNPEPILFASWYPDYREEDDDDGTIEEEPSDLAEESEVAEDAAVEEDYTLAEATPVPQPPETSEDSDADEYRLACEADDDRPLVSAASHDRPLLDWDGPKAWWMQ